MRATFESFWKEYFHEVQKTLNEQDAKMHASHLRKHFEFVWDYQQQHIDTLGETIQAMEDNLNDI